MRRPSPASAQRYFPLIAGYANFDSQLPKEFGAMPSRCGNLRHIDHLAMGLGQFSSNDAAGANRQTCDRINVGLVRDGKRLASDDTQPAGFGFSPLTQTLREPDKGEKGIFH